MAKDKSQKKSQKKAEKKAEKKDSSKVWSIFSLAAALLGATVARKSLTKAWQTATGKNPPANPADRTPYWLLSTRHPRELAAALAGARAADQ